VSDNRRGRRLYPYVWVLGVRVEQQARKFHANLQEIALYSIKNLCLDATRRDACQTQKPHDYLHFCALRNHILD